MFDYSCYLGLIYKHGTTLILAWISNYISYNLCGEITYPFPNFNVCNVWEWRFNFIPHFTRHLIIYPHWDLGFRLIHVSNRNLVNVQSLNLMMSAINKTQTKFSIKQLSCRTKSRTMCASFTFNIHMKCFELWLNWWCGSKPTIAVLGVIAITFLCHF